MQYNINKGIKRSDRYNVIKNFSQIQNQPDSRSGPSSSDEPIDQFKLLYFEKVAVNDNPQLNEQIIAITDKLLKHECITTNQHQNFVLAFK